jgi:hypothetical protein
MLTTNVTARIERRKGRGRSRRWLGVAIGGAMSAVVATGAMAAPACIRPDERVALEVRAVQTNLMVAALSCNFQPAYNDFVRRFRPALDRHNDLVHRFFDRSYGRGGANAATRYFTRFANRSALASVANLDKFCDASAAALRASRTVMPERLDEFARTQDAAEVAAGDFAACTLAKS